MPAVTYTALRRVAAGHSTSVSYSMNIGGSAYAEEWDILKDEAVMLDASQETLFHDIHYYWNFTSQQIARAALTSSYWYEFLASVAGGEAFQFDAYGTVASPDNVIDVIMVGKPDIVPVDDTNFYFKVSFKMRQV